MGSESAYVKIISVGLLRKQRTRWKRWNNLEWIDADISIETDAIEVVAAHLMELCTQAVN